jgi:8-oxo-dGTP pyrophosphatase MutT (NUDIX family)
VIQIRRFNLRVYAIIHNEKGEVLLSKERRGGSEFTKFPGGGVELGEGILEALHRELLEELDAEIHSASLFFVNDFFQLSSFRPEDQIVSFYYLVELKNMGKIQEKRRFPLGSQDPSDFEQAQWVRKNSQNFNALTFPIDQMVGDKLLQD